MKNTSNDSAGIKENLGTKKWLKLKAKIDRYARVVDEKPPFKQHDYKDIIQNEVLLNMFALAYFTRVQAASNSRKHIGRKPSKLALTQMQKKETVDLINDALDENVVLA